MTAIVSGGDGRSPHHEKEVRNVRTSIDPGFAWIGTDFRVLVGNAELGRLCGQPAEALVGQRCQDIFRELGLNCGECPGKEAMATGKPVVKELERKLNDGTWLQVRINAIPTFAENGSVSGFVNIVHDISPLRKLEFALAESENRFRRLADAAPLKIWLSNPTQGYTFLNRCWLEFSGRSLQQELGRGWLENVHPDDRQRCLAVHATAAGQREEFRMEFRMRRSDGVYRWVLLIGKPWFGHDDTFAGHIGICIDTNEHRELEERLKGEHGPLAAQDAERTVSLQEANRALKKEIDERKKITGDLETRQEALSKEHEELNQLFQRVALGKREWELSLDCIKEIVILVDTEGTIRRCNKALVDFTKKGYADLIGRNIREFLKDHRLLLDGLIHQGGGVCFEIDGRWFLVNSYLLDKGRDAAGAVITLYDYTSLKKLARQLENSTQMLEIKSGELEEAHAELKSSQIRILQQDKMATIGQLAAGVAHEINNPIGFISSNLHTLGKYLGKLKQFMQVQQEALQQTGDPDALATVAKARRGLKLDYIIGDIEDLVHESQDGAERVRKIVQDLKTFSRVDDAEWKFVDLVACLESTINIVWNEIKYKATLDREFAELPPLRCYPHQLNQVIMNLLLNASQAIDKEGRITVKAWQEGESLLFSVADTGCGIAQENLNQIFEPFFTTKEVGKGTGLGLSLSYEIVKKHQGDIFVESAVGKGTTFTVRLPIDAEQGAGFPER